MNYYQDWTDNEVSDMFHFEMETFDDLDWDAELQEEYYKRNFNIEKRNTLSVQEGKHGA